MIIDISDLFNKFNYRYCYNSEDYYNALVGLFIITNAARIVYILEPKYYKIFNLFIRDA